MDQHLAQNDRGVNYQLRFMGCVSVNVSMKSLEYEVRSVLTKECIKRVCEAAHMIPEKKRKVDKQIQKFLPGPPNMEHSGANVYLTISTRHIVVSLWSQHQILFDHQILDISFASAGDEDAPDFVAYVGKDEQNGRRCYVFECAVGRALEVIDTIGKAFTARFDQVTSTPVTTVNARGVQPQSNAAVPRTNTHQHQTVPEPPPRVALASSPRSPVLIDLNSSPTRPAPHSYVNAADSFFNDPIVPPLACSKNLAAEPWFHGQLSREESEALVQRDGEFIVRISTKDPNQLVLTGVQNGVHKHLMLIDDEGKVRTRDREFESVSHLIEHHFKNRTPITSAESALLLEYPVARNS